VFVIAIAFAIAAVLTAVVIGFGRILLNVRNKAEQAVGQLTSIPRKTMSFAYSIKRVRSVTTIRNMEGDAVVLRELFGVQPTQSMAMSRLYGKMAGSGEVVVPPRLKSITGGPGLREFRSALTAPGALSYEIDFNRALSHDESVDVAIEADFLRLHKMTRADIDREYRNDVFRHEYTAMTIDVPVGVLELEVVFPAGFEASAAYGVVFYGDSEIVADAESRAIRDIVDRSSGSLVLSVPNPQLRFQYGIYWLPAR
jgi:hypothetical protein